MEYKYDIFISYRRDVETKRWIDDHFVPLLIQRVKPELKRSPVIYIDDQLEAGVLWPKKLGEEISLSRIIMPLWSGDYLNSEWCTCEIAHMMERESQTKWRENNNTGLIFPVIVHDGETLPKELSEIQYIEVKEYFNSRMSIYSEKAEKLSDTIGAASSGIAKLIKNVPVRDTDWKINAVNKFYQQYYNSTDPEQTDLPKFTS